ncbi:aconitase X catalytic domain-containing protein [candidate division KSB1 bacterium]|nr:aconitase X catalytic domain-containing protein [candidate division KSB1 bacterium]
MKLNDDDRDILAGSKGAGSRRAMQILISLANIFEARELIPIESAQIAGVSYLNIGDAGLEFLTDWADQEARVRVPSFMNPAGIDRSLWRKMGIPEEFAQKQMKIITTLCRMGVEDTLTCTPYHIDRVPKMGEHLAWSESSAVSYANSVLGARTNREGGPSALASAIIGKTPAYGLHLTKNRLATHRLHVECNIETAADFNLLGYTIGKNIGDAIPLIDGIDIDMNSWYTTLCLKAFGAAMAASGSIALYHISGVTPEAKRAADDIVKEDAVEIIIGDLDDARRSLEQHTTRLQLVTLGCPHSSFDELFYISNLLKDVTLKIPLWITTSAHVYRKAKEDGIIADIEASGALVIVDTCMVVAPLEYLGYSYIAVDSAKAACYLPSHQHAITYFGSTEQCIKSAKEGRWIN